MNRNLFGMFDILEGLLGRLGRSCILSRRLLDEEIFRCRNPFIRDFYGSLMSLL
jgi:hypothetical protein